MKDSTGKWTGHVTEEWLKNWMDGQLNESEEQEFFRHLGNCDYCAEQFADWLEQDMVEPPAYLQEEILERTRRPYIQTARNVYVFSKRMRLILYSLKVGLAVATSLFLLFGTSRLEGMSAILQERKSDMPQSVITETIDAGTSRMNTILENMTGWLHFIENEEEAHD